MSKKSDDLIMSGVALRAIVKAAEHPITGELVKDRLFADLSLNELMEFDLRETSPLIATLPSHPPEES